MATAPRTTHRTGKGTKLSAVRDASGQFKDIQTYKRAHRADLEGREDGPQEDGHQEGGAQDREEALSARLKGPSTMPPKG